MHSTLIYFSMCGATHKSHQTKLLSRRIKQILKGHQFPYHCSFSPRSLYPMTLNSRITVNNSTALDLLRSTAGLDKNRRRRSLYPSINNMIVLLHIPWL